MKLELENDSTIETIEASENIIRSKRGQEQLDKLHSIGLKEIRFCKFCGSKNIIQTTGYYKHYNCLECGTQRID